MWRDNTITQLGASPWPTSPSSLSAAGRGSVVTGDCKPNSWVSLPPLLPLAAVPLSLHSVPEGALQEGRWHPLESPNCFIFTTREGGRGVINTSTSTPHF